MGTWFKKLEDLLGGGPSGKKRVQTFRWLIVIGLAGIALMILNSFDFIHVKDVASAVETRGSPPSGEAQQTFMGSGGGDRSEFRDYEASYESRLKELLSKIVGVGEVEVMVTVDSTEEIAVDKNTQDSQQVTNEKDTNGATRHITDVNRNGETVMLDGGDGKKPLIIKTIRPKIRGVVVVARGVENLTVKKLVIDAVERGLDVPANRISVIPRKQ